MAAPDLARIVRSGLPALPEALGVLIDRIACTRGSVVRTAGVASRLGLPNRFALVRLLHRKGLPSLRELSSWMRIIAWLVEAERTDSALFVIATQNGRSPAACYRLVKRLTGSTWTELRARGSRWAVEQLESRCREIGQAMCQRVTHADPMSSPTSDCTESPGESAHLYIRRGA